MWTFPIRQGVRSSMQEQALEAWKENKVQGILANKHKQFYVCTLDCRKYLNCPIPLKWRGLLLPSDDVRGVDLTNYFYAANRSINDGWINLSRTHPKLIPWVSERGRYCPLCSNAIGTNRHSSLFCPATRVLADNVRDLRTLFKWQSRCCDMGYSSP